MVRVADLNLSTIKATLTRQKARAKVLAAKAVQMPLKPLKVGLSLLRQPDQLDLYAQRLKAALLGPTGRGKDYKALLEMVPKLNLIDEPQKLADFILSATQSLFKNGVQARILLGEKTFELFADDGAEFDPRKIVLLDGGPLAKQAFEKKEMVLSSDGKVIYVPLKNSKVLGVIEFESSAPFTREEKENVGYFAHLLTSNVHGLFQEKANNIDKLTGLPYGEEATKKLLGEEVYRVSRGKNGSLAVAMIDIDHFKHYNDTYGHLVGSAILKQLGKLLRSEKRIRRLDRFIRYGGEEFFAIFVGTDVQGALIAARRIKELIENNSFRVEYNGSEGEKKVHELKITVSIGIALFPQDGNGLDPKAGCSLENLIKFAEEYIDKADEAMYVAKGDKAEHVAKGAGRRKKIIVAYEKGENRVVTFDEIVAPYLAS